eukprot:2670033-Rhodomonas_salina.1
MGGGNENERRRDVQKAYKKRVRGRSRILLEQISALVPKQDGGGGLRRVHEILRDTLVFAKHILKRYVSLIDSAAESPVAESVLDL